MTMLLERSTELTRFENTHPINEVYSVEDPTYEQVEFFVNDVKTGLLWQQHLAYMALNHSNIILGEE